MMGVYSSDQLGDYNKDRSLKTSSNHFFLLRQTDMWTRTLEFISFLPRLCLLFGDEI